jgi:hypothetical protein
VIEDVMSRRHAAVGARGACTELSIVVHSLRPDGTAPISNPAARLFPLPLGYND